MNKSRVIWGMFVGLLLTILVASCTPQLLETPADANSAEVESTAKDGEEKGAETEAASTLVDVELLTPQDPPFSTNNWTTDFSRRTVEWTEILSGGPPKDGIQFRS